MLAMAMTMLLRRRGASLLAHSAVVVCRNEVVQVTRFISARNASVSTPSRGVDTIITGGTVATADRVHRANVAMSNGKITHVWDPAREPRAGPDKDQTVSATMIDATDLLVLPGTLFEHIHTKLQAQSICGRVDVHILNNSLNFFVWASIHP